jgi:hypothetical protein
MCRLKVILYCTNLWLRLCVVIVDCASFPSNKCTNRLDYHGNPYHDQCVLVGIRVPNVSFSGHSKPGISGHS